MRNAWRWDRTPSKRSVLDALLDKVLGEMYPRSARPSARRHGAPRAPARSRRQDYLLEALEPRLLMSADLHYSGSAGDFTLKAINSTDLVLYDGSNNSAGAVTLSDGAVKISRSSILDQLADG